MHWVYVVECQTPNHFYVGQTNNPKRRKFQHSHPELAHPFVRVHGFRYFFQMFPCATRAEAREVEDRLADSMAEHPDLVIRSDKHKPYGIEQPGSFLETDKEKGPACHG